MARLGRAPVEGVPEAGAVGDVVVGPGRFDHRDRQRLGAVDQGEVGGGADVLGERPQGGQCRLAHQRVDLAAEPQHPEPDPGPATQVASDEGVLFEGGQQSVDHRAIDAELVGQLGDGQAVVGVGEQLEDPEAPVERLRSLRGHDAHSLEAISFG